MTTGDLAIEKLRKAYRVLDVPEAASALAIKSNYKKLIKRWHPDRPTTNAATSDEGMMMAKLLNESYALIENAPLRYYIGNQAQDRASAEGHQRPREKRSIESLSDAEVALIEKRSEYAARIICGVLCGAFVGLSFAVDLVKGDLAIFGAVVLCAIAFGAGAVKLGDKLWREVFGIWWKWQ
jgi:hypothetical protein